MTADNVFTFPQQMHPDAGPPPRERDKQLVNLPDTFWNARSSLKHLRQLAWSRCAPADPVLFGTFARLSGMLHHNVRLDTGIGHASANLFAAVCGASGTGKTSANNVYCDSIALPGYLATLGGPPMFYDGVGLGTGEGLAEVFYGTVHRETGEVDRKGEPKTEKVRAQVRHNVFFYVDEGEALTKMGERAGSTIGPALRTAWTGATLGQCNAREETTRIVPRGTYSMGIVLGYQRETAGALLADAGAGTPQRFLWCYATDPNTPDRPVRYPGQLQVPLDGDLSPGTGLIEFAQEIKDELWARKVARVRGEVEDAELDSHEPLMRAKVAALLAILDGRRVVCDDDWDLSATIWDVSCNVRDDLLAYGQRRAAEEAERRADTVREAAIRTEAEKQQLGPRIERLARLLASKVAEAGGLTRGAAYRSFAGRDRHLFDAVSERAVAEGWVRGGQSGFSPAS